MTINRWNYFVEYEYVSGGTSWGKTDARNRIQFTEYDLKKFSDCAPGGWEIRLIVRLHNPDYRD